VFPCMFFFRFFCLPFLFVFVAFSAICFFLFCVNPVSFFFGAWSIRGKLRASPPLRVGQLDSRRTDFSEILYFNLLLKSGETVEVWLKSDKHNGHFV
jgi:hypothetical protein